MALYFGVPLCGLLQSVTVESKVGSAVAAHAVNRMDEEEEEEEEKKEERETQVAIGGSGHGGWCHTSMHTRMHTRTHAHTHTHTVHMCVCTVCKDLTSLCV